MNTTFLYKATRLSCIPHTLAVGLAIGMVIMPQAARAELPPSAYEAWQKAAPEVLVLTVVETKLKTSKTQDFERTSVFAMARVDKVIRSKSGIKAGKTIEVRTVTEKALQPGWAGPSPVPLLEKGQQYQAWLKPGGKVFYPAAKGRSFGMPPTTRAAAPSVITTRPVAKVVPNDELDCDCAP